MNVFISYSRKDYIWVKKIRTCLEPLVNSGEIIVLSDMDILPGQNWDEQIKQFIELADITIVLISPSYVASNFLSKSELTSILKVAQENCTQVIPIFVESTHLEALALSTQLNKQNLLNHDFLNLSQPLGSLSQNQQDTYLKKLLQLIEEIVHNPDKKINIKKRFSKRPIWLTEKNSENYNIFYGGEENIFIQAERELESNKE
ncbi:toll/interleukin-1 receptor domain-containing protein [Xenococcus sp. PCC 7305]|uniref:toll/interleukin-1 receptor domain-containing protein n=1 Tax=Xenococcus sp. PCC 7305 TaxID=102125 RepID=UPI00130E9089|nr:toll/interleukin-1 receptor domain-containing protein [Xenococcus sp. PCC 7305]